MYIIQRIKDGYYYNYSFDNFFYRPSPIFKKDLKSAYVCKNKERIQTILFSWISDSDEKNAKKYAIIKLAPQQASMLKKEFETEKSVEIKKIFEKIDSVLTEMSRLRENLLNHVGTKFGD